MTMNMGTSCENIAFFSPEGGRAMDVEDRCGSWECLFPAFI